MTPASRPPSHPSLSGHAVPDDGSRLLAAVAATADRIAVIDGSTGVSWTYGRLRDEVRRVARLLADAVGSLVLVHARPDVATLVSLLACLDAGATALPVDADLPADALAGLLVRYRPALVLGGPDVPDGYAPAPRDRLVGAIAGRSSFDAVACHPDLALLVAGSDGVVAPRLVRLSVDAVHAAAAAVGTALGVAADAVVASAVPLHDAGGLTLVAGHLLAGATVVLAPGGAASPAFADRVRSSSCTTVIGGGRDLAALAALALADVASLRDVVVVGADVDADELRALWLVVDRAGRQLHAVHGGPEAGGCCTVLTHDRARTRAGSAGRPVPGGRVEVLAGGDGLVFVGEHVMMGHAIGGADLVKGDELCGRLFTGQRGSVDTDGYVWPLDATARSTA